LMQLEYTIKEYIAADIQKRYSYAQKEWLSDQKALYQEWSNIIKYEKHLLSELGSILSHFYQILQELEQNYKKKSFHDFIKDNSSILHLVSTNNHKYANIKKVSDDAFLFCCQFHNDKTPSMRVNAHSNTARCYGCGTEYNVITYLMAIENLDYYHAIALLCAIYKLEFKNNPYNEESELVQKYTNSYALSKYKKRLETGFKRAKYKNKNFNNYLALKNYERELSLLVRIKKGEYLKRDANIKNKKLTYQVTEGKEK
ncbi:MAG: hypothetical protein K2I70_04650, partial [Bacilli bacterium]|nr:hypothetical protein [Bacilli bacterium]